MKKEMICISCPVGCRLEIEYSDKDNIKVSGNKCVRGEDYGKEEIFSPRRVVTAVVKTDSKNNSYIPVKSDKPIAKEKIFPLLKILYLKTVKLPVKMGEVMLADYENSGINIVYTRSMSK